MFAVMSSTRSGWSRGLRSFTDTLRITINIDDQLLLSAKHRAVERGVPLASIIEEALRQSLAQPVQAQERKPIRLITASGSGVKLGVELDNGRALLGLMDD